MYAGRGLANLVVIRYRHVVVDGFSRTGRADDIFRALPYLPQTAIVDGKLAGVVARVPIYFQKR